MTLLLDLIMIDSNKLSLLFPLKMKM